MIAVWIAHITHNPVSASLYLMVIGLIAGIACLVL